MNRPEELILTEDHIKDINLRAGYNDTYSLHRLISYLCSLLRPEHFCNIIDDGVRYRHRVVYKTHLGNMLPNDKVHYTTRDDLRYKRVREAVKCEISRGDSDRIRTIDHTYSTDPTVVSRYGDLWYYGYSRYGRFNATEAKKPFPNIKLIILNGQEYGHDYTQWPEPSKLKSFIL